LLIILSILRKIINILKPFPPGYESRRDGLSLGNQGPSPVMADGNMKKMKKRMQGKYQHPLF
jgi:hypothetical protein